MHKDTNTPPQSPRANTQGSYKTDKAPSRYVAPQIISHSARELEKQSLRVNACSSYFP